jgi:chitinase
MLLPLKAILLLTLVALGSSAYSLSMFWCGFNWAFCGQSKTDDVNTKANFVMLAFANIQPDGSVLVDDVNFPKTFVTNWKKSGKKVLISVGGASGNWSSAFASTYSRSAFVTTLSGAVQKYGLDGVDLDIEYYGATPNTVANVIISLKKKLGLKIVMVSP